MSQKLSLRCEREEVELNKKQPNKRTQAKEIHVATSSNLYPFFP